MTYTDELEEIDILAELELDKPTFDSCHWDTEEYPELTYIAEQIERMGFKIYSRDRNTQAHTWKTGIWECVMLPKINCVRLNYKQPSGNMFSELSMSVETSSLDDIVKSVAKSFFYKDDENDIKMIKRDREAWNSAYSAKLGKW